MLTLVIDTSGRACSIALVDGDTLVAERHDELGRGHAERLLPWIAELPGGGRAARIVAGCGPGSFTGVRIGIAAARALALGWGVTVLGVPSFALIVAGRAEPALTVAREAGHGELFVQDYAGVPLAPATPLRSLAPAEAAAQFRNPLVLGNGAAQLVAARGFGTACEAEPRAAAFRLVDALALTTITPIYGRDADARPMQRQ